MEIITCTHDLERKAGAYLSTALNENKDIPILLLLSGGSALTILEYVDFKSVVRNITVSVLDERYTADINGSNFEQIKEKLFDIGVRFMPPFPMTVDGQEEAASFFEASLRDWKNIYSDGVIIAVMGMGTDGHTAGIFPNTDYKYFNPSFIDTKKYVHGYRMSDKTAKYPSRVTVTSFFLKSQVDYALMFVSGKDKNIKNLVKDIPVHNMPAQIIKEMKRVTVMTDTDLNKI